MLSDRTKMFLDRTRISISGIQPQSSPTSDAVKSAVHAPNKTNTLRIRISLNTLKVLISYFLQFQKIVRGY